MLNALVFALFLCNSPLNEWQTYTNTNYIFDITGSDSIIYLATAGGVIKLAVKPEPPRVEGRFLHTDGLRDNRCLCVALDSSDNLWVGTCGAGASVIPGDSGVAQPYRTGELPTTIKTLIIAGTRVLAGTDEGLFVIDTRGTPLDFADDVIRQFRVNSVRELLSDRILALLALDGYFWIGTNQGITCVDSGFRLWRAFRRPLGDSVSAIGALPSGKIVIGTEAGLATGDTTGFRTLWFFPAAKTVNDIAVDGWDIYVATQDTVFKGDTAGTFIPVFVGRPVSLWMSEVCWLGSGGSEEAGWGLFYQRSGSSWEGVPIECLVSNVISDCAFGKDGSVYLGHNSSWLSRIMPDGRIQALVSPLPWVVQTRCDSRGRIWFTHFSYQGGVSVYDPDADTWGVVQWGQSTARNVIQAFGLDRFDTKWVFNLAGQIIAIDSNGNHQEFNLPELVPPPGGSYEFAFDSRNRVWLGLNNGLEELDYRGTLFDPGDDYHVLHSSGLPSTEVRSVAVDQQDRVWVGTPQGGAMWDGRAFKIYNTSNSGLLSNNIYRVRVDGAGRVWFLSDRGLSILDVVSGRWTNYTAQNSGMLPNFQGLAGFFTALDLDDPRGLAGIGSLRGFSIFRFAKEPDTVISGLKVYPNPCIIGEHSGVVVDGLPRDARVQVYTISGKPVASPTVSPGLGRAVWYPGRVASGLYVIVITSGAGVRTERVALITPNNR